MNIESWNTHYSKAARIARLANDDPRLCATKRMSNELLEFVLNNDYPGVGGVWHDNFIKAVKRELENRISNILLEE